MPTPLSLLKRRLFRANNPMGSREGLIEAIELNKLDLLEGELRRNGEHLTADDFLDEDRQGMPALADTYAVRNADKVLKILHENGETIDLEKFAVRKYRDIGYPSMGQARLSILERVERAGAVESLFAPEIWVGRIDEMDELYDKVTEHRKRSINIDAIREKVAELTYGDIEVDENLTKESLFTPDDEGNIPLAGKVAWQQIRPIMDKLEERGEDPLTKADLKRMLPTGKTLMKNALEMGRGMFNNINEVLKRAGEKWTLEDLVENSPGGEDSVLKTLADRMQLRLLFTKDNFETYAEARKVWDRVPNVDKSQVDFVTFTNEFNTTSIGDNVPSSEFDR